MKTEFYKIVRRSVIICGILVVSLIAFLAILISTGHSWPPDERIISEASSPGNQWLAVIETREYKSMFTPPTYAVALRPKIGWFQKWRGKEIFEVSQESATFPPSVIWLNDNNLNVKISALRRDIIVQIPEVYNVKISYTIN